MIRFHTGDPGGVPASLSSDSEIAPRLLDRAVTGGSLPQFTEEEINSSHWWSSVISASQFKQLDFLVGIGVKTSGAGKRRPFKQGEIG